ncbi:MAG: ATP synthase F0 subunit B [Cyanobacteriota bacterium]|nr:ATP synthase F0 subunit B [Cyanobacteriota bacterium]
MVIPLSEHSSDFLDQTIGLMNVQEALDRLEDTVVTSPRFFWSRTLINEDQLLDHLDLIRISLPSAFEEAETILLQRDRILQDAQRYAEEVVALAKRQAEQLVKESVILRQAQAQAEQILRQTYQEREALRRQALQEAERLRQDAEHYVDQVLQDLEYRLVESLQVVRQGRQHLHPQR